MGGVDGIDRDRDLEMTQAALRDDLETVRAYGEAHPESWVGVRFSNDPTVRLVASFTGELAGHDRALRRVLSHPDRLVLEPGRHTSAELQAMTTEIDDLIARRVAETGRSVSSGIGEGVGVVQVHLRADQEDFAAELAQRYGPAVELRVGAFTYPGRRRPEPRGRVRPGTSRRPAPPEEVHLPGLELRVEVDRAVVEVGDDGHGKLVFHNGGDAPVGPLYGGQPLTGVLYDDAGERVGGSGLPTRGTGWVLELAPGETASVEFFFGTASCRKELGYVLPPGEYGLEVAFAFGQGLSGQPTQVLRAPRTRLRVTAPDH